MLVAMPLINWLGELNSHIPLPDTLREIEDNATRTEMAFLKDQTIGDFFLNILMFALIAAVAEELFFRGAMQKILIGWTKNIHTGIWITAILFSALHFQFMGFVPRMLMGAMLGYVYIWSGSLWVSIFTHFVNNGVLVFLMYLEQKNLVPEKIDEVGGHEGQIVYVIASAVLLGVVLFFSWRGRETSASI